MEAAKKAVADFTARTGHSTEVDEIVRPAVTLQTIKPTRHEITTEAIDREVHRHHYHTTVQPISHREEIPTKHTHNLLDVLKRDHTHKTKEHNDKVRDSHAKELALFTHHSITHPTTHTKAHLPQVIGEHVHHHVHEVVQPVIHKETHQPEIVHTTMPIHELHHNEPIHHPMSELSMLSLEEFMSRKKSGVDHIQERYEGKPRPYNTKLHADISKFIHKPSAINTTAGRHSTSTPPLSPASAASSESMPSTPKMNNAAEPGFRHSEDSMHDLNLSSSPTTKTPLRAHNVPMGGRVHAQ